MSRYTSEAAVEMIGDRFMLILAASQRSRELKNGSPQRVSGTDASSNVTALREIEEGKYTLKEYLTTLKTKQQKNHKGYRDEYFPT